MNATETAQLTDERVLELEGTLRLAVDGDTLTLRADGDPVDQVSYERAPLADQWYRTAHSAPASATAQTPTDADGQWWPRDATCLPVSSAEVESATVFVLPDGPDIPLETIREAEDRLLLAGYTLTSESVADELVAAHERGVDVAVLLESGPVGGTPETTESLLEMLEENGVEVRATGGEGARYRYHHPKYAVADDHVLVMSENWNPSGVGGESSRGWGVSLEDEALAADLETVFDTDFAGWDTARMQPTERTQRSSMTRRTQASPSPRLTTPNRSQSSRQNSSSLPITPKVVSTNYSLALTRKFSSSKPASMQTSRWSTPPSRLPTTVSTSNSCSTRRGITKTKTLPSQPNSSRRSTTTPHSRPDCSRTRRRSKRFTRKA